jgi:tellurite resistance protein TehA-like permease
VLTRLAGFSPAYFGMAMAIGILALGCHALALPRLGTALYRLDAGIYVALWALTIARAVLHPRRILGDLADHQRAPGFFTTVAATGLLGSQCIVLAGADGAGFALWALTLALWIATTYAVFGAIIAKKAKPTLAEGIGGSWLLAVVATQSVAVLSALLAARTDQPHRLELNFLAVSTWLWGGMLYVWIIGLVFHRVAFFALEPADLAPPYWISMGAMAISTLAGSLLVANAADAPLLRSLLPVLKGGTVLCWATGTWWIPMLLVLGAWKHAVRRFPLRYDPLVWSAVFPLGMYAAGTQAMVDAMGLGFLAFLPPLFLYAGLAVCAAAFAGLALRITRR